MVLDRVLQNKILNIAMDCYPRSVNYELDELFKNIDNRKIAANLMYLAENKLLKDNPITITLDNNFSIEHIKITHKGIDFLQDDGGLSAILDVVTVKFEADTLKAILENRISQSDLGPEEKQSMIDSLRELPAESIKHLTTELLTRSLDNLPAAILLIGTFIGLS